MRIKTKCFWFKAVAVSLSLTLLSQDPSVFFSTNQSNQSLSSLLAPSSFGSVLTRTSNPQFKKRPPSRIRTSLARLAIGIGTGAPSTILFLAGLLGGLFMDARFARAQENSTPSADTDSNPQIESERFQVVQVVDGDTIDVLINGVEERVRFIGIDTPEVTHNGEETVSRDYYGAEASEFCKSLIIAGGGYVRLEADPNLTDRCDYGRLLRYVWVTLPDPEHEGGTIEVLVNLKLIEEGCAEVFWRSIQQCLYCENFFEARRAARERHIGIWDREAARRWRSREKTRIEKLLDALIFNREAEKIFSSV